jgi:hypothetical protein
MLLNKALCLADFSPGQAGVLGDIYRRFEPELCFTVLTLNMHVHPRFFTREEVEPEAAFSKYGGTHWENNTRC